ncbi:MAG: hypothetical protein EXR75_02030 [Myxococcales bacterium]|nr:hypothetical protein [Myxococcales bacterium]
MASPDEWRWTDDEGVQRLLGGDELRAALRNGGLRGSTLVWRRGMQSWVAAETIAELGAVPSDGSTTVARERPAGSPASSEDTSTALRNGDAGALGTAADTRSGFSGLHAPGRATMPTPSVPPVDERRPRVANMINIAALRGEVTAQRNTIVGHATTSGEGEHTLTGVRRNSDEDTKTNALGDIRASSTGPAPTASRSATTTALGSAAAQSATTTALGSAAAQDAPPPSRGTGRPPPVARSRRAVAVARDPATLVSPENAANGENSVIPAVAVRLARTSARTTQARDGEAHALVRPGTATHTSEGAPPPARDAIRPDFGIASMDAAPGPAAPPQNTAVWHDPPRGEPELGGARTEPDPAMHHATEPRRGEVPSTARLPQWPPSQHIVAHAPAFSHESWMPAVAARKSQALVSVGALVAALRQYSAAVPRAWLAGALGALAVALVLAFVAGRVSGGSAPQVGRARAGLASVPLFVGANSRVPTPRPCLMLRAPAGWAPLADRRVPAQLLATSDGKIAIGFASGPNEARGLVLDPRSGEVLRRFEPPSTGGKVSRVVPVPGEDGPNFVVLTGEDGGMTGAARLGAARQLMVGMAGEGLAAVDGTDATKPLWPVPNGGATKLQLAAFGPDARDGYGVTYLVGNEVHYGAVRGDGTITNAGAAIAASGGKVGRPMLATDGRDVSVVYAEVPSEGERAVLRWARGPVGKPLLDAGVVELPVGGPGGDAIAPDIAALSGGRWLLFWTEGKAGDRVLRAQTFDRRGARIGDALRVSPATGNFGQGTLAVVGETAAVAFLLSKGQAYELWGTVLQCQ